jgi:hypothetical protein
MGVSGQRHAPAALLPPGKEPPVPIGQEAGWTPEPVWTQRLEEKSSAPAGDRTSIKIGDLRQSGEDVFVFLGDKTDGILCFSNSKHYIKVS